MSAIGHRPCGPDRGRDGVEHRVEVSAPLTGDTMPAEAIEERLAVGRVLEQAVDIHVADRALLPAEAAGEVSRASRPAVVRPWWISEPWPARGSPCAD
jgi:hypothetical protein